jgi:TatD DNase family protein
MLGIGGLILNEKLTPLHQAVKETPIEKLLTETDAPFLIPHARRTESKINRSGYIKDIIAKIAEIKAMPEDEVEEILWDNAKSFFGVN